MKKMLVLTVLMISLLPLVMAQGNISEKNKARASKKGLAEAKMFEKKGFVNVVTHVTMEDELTRFYEYTFEETTDNARVYVWGMGNGKGGSREVAFNDAFKDARNHIPGLMLTYFNMWTMTKQETTAREKDIISAAINDAEDLISSVLLAETPLHVVHLVREQKGKFTAQVRVLFNQQAMRSLTRTEIMKILKKKTDWSDDKLMQVLTFEK